MPPFKALNARSAGVRGLSAAGRAAAPTHRTLSITSHITAASPTLAATAAAAEEAAVAICTDDTAPVVGVERMVSMTYELARKLELKPGSIPSRIMVDNVPAQHTFSFTIPEQRSCVDSFLRIRLKRDAEDDVLSKLEEMFHIGFKRSREGRLHIMLSRVNSRPMTKNQCMEWHVSDKGRGCSTVHMRGLTALACNHRGNPLELFCRKPHFFNLPLFRKANAPTDCVYRSLK